MYTFNGEFRTSETSLLVNTSGIRAATENPQRIRTDKDVRGSMQKQVFCQKNLSLKSVHGSTLFNSLRLIFACALSFQNGQGCPWIEQKQVFQ